jgi:hypothetical protein
MGPSHLAFDCGVAGRFRDESHHAKKMAEMRGKLDTCFDGAIKDLLEVRVCVEGGARGKAGRAGGRDWLGIGITA